MKKFLAAILLAIFSLNALFGIAGGVLLCFHTQGAHIELVSAHECCTESISADPSHAMAQGECDHLGDFVLIGDEASSSPKIVSDNAGIAQAEPLWQCVIEIFFVSKPKVKFNWDIPIVADSCATNSRIIIFSKLII